MTLKEAPPAPLLGTRRLPHRPQQQLGHYQINLQTDYYPLRPLTLKLSSPVMAKALSLLLQVRKALVNLIHALQRILIGVAAKEENEEAEVVHY
jgi:hypothetical protein